MINFLKILLFPVIPLYAIAVAVRNWLFEIKIFKESKVEAKIISVGNLTVGGSGKTPMVIYLLEHLKKYGLKAGVLSRGYGRESRGYLLVSDGNRILTSVDQCGDEIFQTISDCLIPGAVSENRVKGAERLIKETGVKIIVLDDAFQHRWIYRDLDLLVCEQKFLLSRNFLVKNLFPTGNMREPFTAVKRADAVIINRKFALEEEIPDDLKTYFEGKKIFRANYMATGFVDIKRNEYHKIEEFKGQKSLVVSGIADPFSLMSILAQNGVNTENRMVFIDHKNYSNKEIQSIRKKFYSSNSHSVITTQKDAVKLVSFAKEFDDIDIFYLKIKMEMSDEGSFNKFIVDKLNLNQ
ncbi:MAG: tetraacyldisaccharide 4'-kinase [Ignavibacteriaceae bacterium]|nr:tetraacyldisaccharide 4'-kinase [Ignavibacteriaceae bacterium]